MNSLYDKKTGTQLVEISYNRRGVTGEKRAIVTEQQAYDIRFLLPHIRITEIKFAPPGSKRDYLLM